MIGGAFNNDTILIYNVLSGTCLSCHSISQPIFETAWTCGEYLQFAIAESGSIEIWQVSFISSHTPTKVGSLSTPDNFSSNELVLFPTLSRLAFILDGEVLVWDAQHHKVLLHSTDAKNPRAMSFSPNGHFFVCGTKNREFHIWKESAAGYHSHQKLGVSSNTTTPLVSPNGESVISWNGRVVHLWNTVNSPISIFGFSRAHYSGWFFLEFSSDESQVAVIESFSTTVTILDIKSGKPWLVIDADTKLCGLRMTEDKIIAVGDGKIFTWNLPERDSVVNNWKNTVQTTAFKHSAPIRDLYGSVSPNLSYLALGDRKANDISIYNTHTGEKLAAVKADGYIPGFTPSGHGVWYARKHGAVNQWEIIEANGSNTFQLKGLEMGVEPQHGFPWHSPDGYQITKDGWITSSSGKWLLWLPHHWQPDITIQRRWSGKFLAVWNRNSPEPCILKLEV